MRLQMKSILACIGFVWAIAQMAVEKGFRSWFQDAEHIQMGHTEMKIKVDASAKASWLSGIQDLQFISPPHQNLWVNSGSGSSPRLW